MTTVHLKTRTDSEIQKAVQSELDWDPRVDAPSLVARIKEGIVTLTGSVDHFAKKTAACNAAHHVEGVLDVVDEIQVKFLGAIQSDVDLAQAVRNALVWDVYVPDRSIQSTVSDGWVTLEGEVDQAHQREDALRAIERLSGIRGVTNKIRVRMEGVDSSQVKSSIEAALQRRARRAAKAIQVDVEGHTVKLSGSVDSWAERHAVERTALFAPGVTKVENKLSVLPYA